MLLFKRTATLAAAAAFLGAAPQSAPAETDHARVVNTLCQALQDCYVFEDVADRTAEHLKAQLADGAYAALDGHELAARLQEDGMEILNDHHFSVNFNPDLAEEYVKPVLEEEDAGWMPPQADLEEWIKNRRAENVATNYGFEEVSILEGGVGYIKLNEFRQPVFAAHIYSAAVSFVQDANAIIIDLRSNQGGASSGLQLLASFFFPSGDYHLNTYETRVYDQLEQTWTLPAVDGPRIAYTPVYILTSPSTFSAAESFTYSMQALNRATVVGDRTGGGAHRVMGLPINQGIYIACPYSRNVNPVTGTNWEGVGVQPDIKVDPADALTKAHALALEEAVERYKDDEIRSRGLAWAAPIIRARAEPVYVSEELLAEYAGNYGPRRVVLQDGTLHYARADGPLRKLVPLSQDTFMIEDTNFFKMTFERDEAGRIFQIHGFYSDGREDHSPRDGDS